VIYDKAHHVLCDQMWYNWLIYVAP